MKKFLSKLKVITITCGIFIIPCKTYAYKHHTPIKRTTMVAISTPAVQKATILNRILETIANNTQLPAHVRVQQIESLAPHIYNVASTTQTPSLIKKWHDIIFNTLTQIPTKKEQIDLLLDMVQKRTQLYPNKINCHSSFDMVSHVRSFGINYEKSKITRVPNADPNKDAIRLEVYTQHPEQFPGTMFLI